MGELASPGRGRRWRGSSPLPSWSSTRDGGGERWRHVGDGRGGVETEADGGGRR